MNTLLLNNPAVKALLASYGRSFLAGGLTLLLAGADDPKSFGLAFLAAVVPVLLRAANPKDAAFGKIVSPTEMQKAIDEAVAFALAEKEAEDKKKAQAAARAAKKTANTKRTTK